MTEQHGGSAAGRPQRKAMLTKAVLWHGDAQVATVRVRNLSRQGLGGEASEPVHPAEAYDVELRGVGRIPGTIAWVDGARFGMRFDTEIDLQALEMASPAEVSLSKTYTAPRSFEPTGDYKRPGFHTRK